MRARSRIPLSGIQRRQLAMSTPIVRLYADEAKARQALQALRDERFAQDDINLLLPAAAAAADASDSLESLVSAIVVGISRGRAKDIANAIRGGQSMVAVRAAWGLAGSAIRVLDAHGPASNPLPQESAPVLGWDNAAPLSSALRLPTLMRGAPMPFSNLFGVEDLAPSKPIIGGLRDHRFTVFGEPGLSRNPAPLSSLFGLATLTRGGRAIIGGLVDHAFYFFGSPRLKRDPAPLSRMLGWPPLSRRGAEPTWDEAAPLSSAFGLRTVVRREELSSAGRPQNLADSKPIIGGLVSHRFSLFGEPGLSRKAAPLSSLFGLPTLTRDGKPFFGGLSSSGFYLFGKPRLSRNPSPLSSLIGWGPLRRR
jgi:hypothetical protein